MQSNRLASLDAAGSVDLVDQEAGSLTNTAGVSKMGWGDGEGAGADKVTAVADDESLLAWEVWDLAVVLLVAGVTVENNTLDAVLDGLGEILNGAMAESGTLGVTSNNDLGVRAAGSGLVEEVLHLADSAEISSTWEEVGGEESWVVNALNSDVVAAESALQALTGWWADGASHVADLSGATGPEEEDWSAATADAAGVLILGGTDAGVELALGDLDWSWSWSGEGNSGEGGSNDGGNLHVCGW